MKKIELHNGSRLSRGNFNCSHINLQTICRLTQNGGIGRFIHGDDRDHDTNGRIDHFIEDHRVLATVLVEQEEFHEIRRDLD